MYSERASWHYCFHAEAELTCANAASADCTGAARVEINRLPPLPGAQIKGRLHASARDRASRTPCSTCVLWPWPLCRSMAHTSRQLPSNKRLGSLLVGMETGWHAFRRERQQAARCLERLLEEDIVVRGNVRTLPRVVIEQLGVTAPGWDSCFAASASPALPLSPPCRSLRSHLNAGTYCRSQNERATCRRMCGAQSRWPRAPTAPCSLPRTATMQFASIQWLLARQLQSW
jgi:hypothetical protein